MAYLDSENEALSDDVKNKLLRNGAKANMAKAGLNMLAAVPSQNGGAMHETETSPVQNTNFLDDQEALILSLRLQLNRETEKSTKCVQAAEDFSRRKLKQQKETYEAKLRHQITLHTEMVEAKKALEERCESLASEMRQAVTKYEQKLADQEKRNQEEMTRSKTQWAAAEKLRRQKWIQQRAQEIKENTLKSMEPEIQHVLDVHREESQKMQDEFELLLKESDARAEQTYAEKLRGIEEAVAQRINDVRSQERNLAEQLYTEKLADCERNFRIDVARREEEARVNRETFEERLRCQHEEIARIRREGEEMRMEAINEERQRAANERAEMEANHKDLVYKRRLEKETSGIRAKRDHELAQAMSAMSDELATLQMNLEKSSEVRVTRLQQRYQQEIDELNTALDVWKRASQEVKEQARVQRELDENQRTIQHDLERRLQEAERTVSCLEAERDRVSEVFRQEYSTKLMDMDLLNQKLRRELNDIESRYEKDTSKLNEQIEFLKRDNDAALDAINERVRDMLQKKDVKIEMLRAELVQLHGKKLASPIIPATKASVDASKRRAISAKPAPRTSVHWPDPTKAAVKK
ncbi:hypothetical protein RvY_11005 [Ramazzottius varieornatus]|uniref:Uncharacterized protein n=1 Tax=Ramazzottius varieornatus TaxID=947166 RepID=A0A1D1VGR3_RAMVA|nr:hypothetical protein RvY_11005 [Ramazzottius varieornatus]